MTKRRKPIRDLRLKIAILESHRTQRYIGIETRIGETRLSEIVRGHGNPPTPLEKARIAKVLNRPLEDLFSLESEMESQHDLRS